MLKVNAVLYQKLDFLFFKNLLFQNFKDLRRKMGSEQSASSSNVDHSGLIKKIQEFIPKLTPNLHKGQCGRIGIIGGSVEYTGAPYFAAMSALKTGADLVYVFCCREAGPVIKSYSPELIVHPFLDDEDVVAKIEPWLQKLHTLVIGPGLGRDPGVLSNVGKIISFCKEKLQSYLPLIIDADGLYLITENPILVKSYNGPVILTPNPVEFGRLKNKLSVEDPLKIASELNIILVQKGLNDVITNGVLQKTLKLNQDEITLKCDVPGSNRRCGGQGDILAGSMATFVAWYHLSKSTNFSFDVIETISKGNNDNKLKTFNEKFLGYSLAAYGACTITRSCSKMAFEANGRSMTASSMIPFINEVFKKSFEQS